LISVRLGDNGDDDDDDDDDDAVTAAMPEPADENIIVHRRMDWDGDFDAVADART
jgi:hypothetical protein